MTQDNKLKIENAVRDILQAIGEDPERDGLKETPDRVARMLEELTSGYHDDAKVHLAKIFVESGSDVVIEKTFIFLPLASIISCRFSEKCTSHISPTAKSWDFQNLQEWLKCTQGDCNCKSA